MHESAWYVQFDETRLVILDRSSQRQFEMHACIRIFLSMLNHMNMKIYIQSSVAVSEYSVRF